MQYLLVLLSTKQLIKNIQTLKIEFSRQILETKKETFTNLSTTGVCFPYSLRLCFFI